MTATLWKAEFEDMRALRDAAVAERDPLLAKVRALESHALSRL